MNENNKLSVPTLSVKVTYQKIPVRKKIARIVALVLAGILSVAGLASPTMSVRLYYTHGSISGWSEVCICLLLAAVLVLAAAFLICELLGYTRLKFTATAVSASILLWVISSCRSYFISMNSNDTLSTWLLNNLPLYLFALIAVFLFGKFVLFKKQREEREE